MGELGTVTRPAGGDLDIAAVGTLVADPARCRILLALGDGRALPANRLAADAGISAATASSHLGKLTGAGLLTVEARGRYRYYRHSGPEVGNLIEALEGFARPLPVRSLRQSRRAVALRQARTCYDHLAGRLGVELMLALIEHGYLVVAASDEVPTSGGGADVDYALSAAGRDVLVAFGIGTEVLERPVRHHQDSSEQRPHLAGPLGRGLLDRLRQLRWVHPATDSRAVTVTPTGRRGLAERFGIDLTDPPA